MSSSATSTCFLSTNRDGNSNHYPKQSVPNRFCKPFLWKKKKNQYPIYSFPDTTLGHFLKTGKQILIFAFWFYEAVNNFEPADSTVESQVASKVTNYPKVPAAQLQVRRRKHNPMKNWEWRWQYTCMSVYTVTCKKVVNVANTLNFVPLNAEFCKLP